MVATSPESQGRLDLVSEGRPAAVVFAGGALAMRGVPLDRDVRHAARRALLDWYAAAMVGSVSTPARLLAETVLTEGTGISHLVGHGRTTGCRVAALVNGVASHAAEVDDVFRDGIYHPGAPTISAALAVAERRHSSGEALLRAVAVGYEIGCRIAAVLNPAHYRYWHTTGTVGTLGAAAAAAEILELDAGRFAHALATAATMAAGLQQAFRSDAMSKPLHAGHAAEAGVLAAMAVGNGFTGVLDVLDAPGGFGEAMAGISNWSGAFDAWSKPPAITQVTVKVHSCCGHAFVAVDAALDLRALGIRIDDISEVSVDTYTVATIVAGITEPKTAFEAKFSIAYCVAAALMTGSVGLSAFEDSMLVLPALQDLADRICVAADSEMDAMFPDRRMARVTVRRTGGEVHVADRSTCKGDPDDPVTDAELHGKFQDLVVPLVGEDVGGRLAEQVWEVAELHDVGHLPFPRVFEG